MSNRHDVGVPSVNWMLAGGGESAALMRRIDWDKTPIGPMHRWSSSLKTTVATLLHSRHPMFLWWGPDLTQIYNDAYVPSFGVGKHPAAMGQRARDCWPEIWDIIGPQIDNVMARGIASWHEDALVPIFRNGTIEEVYWTYGYSPVFDDDGRIGGTLVVCTETTARVVAVKREQILRDDVERERERLREFFAQAPAGICLLRGSALMFEFANDHYHALVGGRALIGRPLLEALPELQGQGLDVILHNVMASEQPFFGREWPVRIDRHGNGDVDEAFYTFVYSPFRDATGPVDAIIVLALDVTDEVVARRQTEALARQLRETEAQFHQLAESIPQLAWSARPDGHIDWYNQRWYEYTGTTLESMQGWGWTSVHDPDRVDDVLAHWRKCLFTGEPFEMEFPLRGKDGALRWYLTRALPFTNDDTGEIVRWFGTSTDIDTSRRAALERSALLENERQAREVAERANRAKDDFLSIASHELRTPLNAILGWSRLLQAGHLDAVHISRAFDIIERNARAQVQLIEDILDGARIINGQLRLEVSSLDLVAVIHSALDTIRAAADEKSVSVSLDCGVAAAPTVGDPERLQQVVWNLVSNAIKFTPSGGSVRVSLQRIDDEAKLEVWDTGQGIDPTFLPYVFERFRQADGSTTRRYGGLGLGLALVSHLVQAHGGRVSAASEGSGKGSVFTVTLPLRAMDAASVGPHSALGAHGLSPAHAPGMAGLHVLVVDDETDARDLVATALRARGAAVTTAADAETALALLRAQRFSVLVSDVGMPGSDGYDLLQALRRMSGAREHLLPAIALTAYSRDEDRRRAEGAGFQAYLSKPVDLNELANLIMRLVSGRQA